MIERRRYLHKAARRQIHFDDKHDWNPDDGAAQHQPPEDHGPRWVVIFSISHWFPLVEAEAQDELKEKQRVFYQTPMYGKDIANTIIQIISYV